MQIVQLLTLALFAVTPLPQWPRMRADVFGCMLENEYGHKDATFNCAINGYENKGDPCTNPTTYYEGPTVPARLVTGARDVRAEWEHGELRALHITLTGVLSEEEAKKRLSLPATLPPNIMRIDVQGCAKDATCVTIEGFEHQGAGEVECPAAVESLCEPSEQLLFTCQRAASGPAKHISICQAGKIVRYRFGRIGKVELDYPKGKKSAASAFWFGDQTSADGRTSTLRFENGKTAYELVIEETDIPTARLFVYLPNTKPMPIDCKPGFSGGLPASLRTLIPRVPP